VPEFVKFEEAVNSTPTTIATTTATTTAEPIRVTSCAELDVGNVSPRRSHKTSKDLSKRKSTSKHRGKSEREKVIKTKGTNDIFVMRFLFWV
jgi:hypothetical protein